MRWPLPSIRGGLPKWHARPAADLLRRRLQLCRRAAGLCLHRHAWALRARSRVWLRDRFGINLRALGFNLLSFWGLTITYLFFQIPLMILIITPALDGLKREWREAATVLGCNRLRNTGAWWRLPILLPSLLGTFALLFANAFGAVATAFALTGPQLNIVPIMLFAQIRGDVLGDPHLGYALAFGMIVITGIANTDLHRAARPVGKVAEMKPGSSGPGSRF